MLKRSLKTLIVLLVIIQFFPTFLFASTTQGIIQTPNQYAWGENTGWINFAPNNSNIQITDVGITGYAWDSNFGWINLSPDNGGIKNDGNGDLSGMAWSSGAGWINFSGVIINSSGKFTGMASGSVYGRINFDCNDCNVTTDWRPQSVRNALLPIQSGSGFGNGAPAGAFDQAVASNHAETGLSDTNSAISPVVPQVTTTYHTLNSIFGRELGLNSIGPDVQVLQKFLNARGFFVAQSGPGSPGQETTYFGPATEAALIRFQNANYQKIFAPLGTAQATGYLGSSTIAVISNIMSGQKTLVQPSVSQPLAVQISSISTAMSTSASIFIRTLKIGSIGDDVKRLQMFLNAHGFIVSTIGLGSPGHESLYFGQATKTALMRFQSAYAGSILVPNGLTSPTGIFGTSTMKVVNIILK